MKRTTIEFVEEARALASAAGLDFDRLEFRDDLGLSADFVQVFAADSCIATAKFNRGLKSFTTNEAAALRLLEEHEFEGVPSLLAQNQRAILLRWFPEEGEVDWSRAGVLLARLHQIDASQSGLKYTTDPLPLGERLLSTATRAISKIGDAELRELAKLAVGRLEEGADQIKNAGRLIHRDLRPANWLAHNGAALLDFEHAACGNPAWDFVKLGWWTRDEHRARILDTYRHERDLPPEAEIRLFSLYESVSMLGFFEGRNAGYVESAVNCIHEMLV